MLGALQAQRVLLRGRPAESRHRSGRGGPSSRRLNKFGFLTYYRGAHAAEPSAERGWRARQTKERCPDLLALWAREEQKRKEIAYTGAYVSVDPHENAFNPDGTVNTERHFEKGRVYPEFLKWRPSLDRLPVAATAKRAGRVRGGVAIL